MTDLPEPTWVEQAGRTDEVKRVNPERGYFVDADGLENVRKAVETGSPRRDLARPPGATTYGMPARAFS